MCSLNVAKFVNVFTVLSAHPIVCQPVTNVAFSKFINSSARISVSTRSPGAYLFVSALVCPWPLVNTFLSASIAQLLVKFSTIASACPQDQKLTHQCVSSYDHLSIYTLLTHTHESVVRALGNLPVCAPLSGQSPTRARWERASLDGTRTYGRHSSIYKTNNCALFEQFLAPACRISPSIDHTDASSTSHAKRRRR